MAKQNIKLRMRGKYSGHNIKANGVINLNFNFDYTELVTVIPLVQMLNNTVDLIARVEKNTIKLGEFMLNQVKINHDGTSNVRFNAIVDNVDADNLNRLYGDEVQIQAMADIELEDEDNE